VIAYVDTSALLRLILREAGALDDLRSSERFVSSELLAVEAPRTIDRLRLQGKLSLDEAVRARSAAADWLEAVDLVLLRAPILARAAEPFPVALGTLDALHLATALIWRERMDRALVIATHDEALGGAARIFGFEVIGAAETSA
jgi:predicted nucleic acid-binding protein